MKRSIIGTILAGALAVGIAGCSSTGQSSPQEPLVPAEDAYLSEVWRDVPASRDIPMHYLIEYGETVCLAFDHGFTVEDLGRIADEEGISPRHARWLGQMAGIAVRNLCPEHVATVLG